MGLFDNPHHAEAHPVLHYRGIGDSLVKQLHEVFSIAVLFERCCGLL